MQCPKCKSTTLKNGKLPATQLVLDQCPTCKGIWFDKGELTTLLGPRAKKDFAIPDFSMKVPDTECPRCRIILYGFCYPGTLTLVDGCKKCEGVWLDDKEWKAISHARDESNNISCPDCHTRQKPAESCIKCGTVFAKYHSARADKNPGFDSGSTKHSDDSALNEKSYADGIPGLKGALLRMIDHAIKRLSSSIF